MTYEHYGDEVELSEVDEELSDKWVIMYKNGKARLRKSAAEEIIKDFKEGIYG